MHRINTKRLIFSILAVFAFFFIYDVLYNAMLMKDIFQENSHLWRPKSQQQIQIMWWTIGQFVFSIVFCISYARLFESPCIKRGIEFGIWVGVFMIISVIFDYATMPVPEKVSIFLAIGALIGNTIAGAILGSIYKSKEQ